MPLTKPKETEALKVYHQYWDSYFNRDVTTFGTTLDEAFEMIGTSSSEICHNKADGIAFLQAQITEVVGKVEMRNRTISSKQVNNMFLILENCDIYVAGEPEWNFYSKLRLSTLLHETASGWKVLQQHGSIPDGKVQEGETLAFQKISKENLELRDAVKRRTAELENKNRELEIEAALERVRGLTMAMHSSEDMGKCIIKMFSELTALGVDEGTRFGIGILNHDNENNQLWTARKDGDEVKMHIGNIDMASHPLLKSARKAWKAQIPFHKYVLEGEDLLNYYRMLNNAPDYKIQIPLEKLPKKEIQHCFIFEHGFFYAFSPREFQPNLIHITKRFSSLFEQTYRRYLDLVKAESQAREAQIEAALERVRSCSLAMHKSEELHKVIFVVAEQIAGLDIYYDSVHFLDIQEDGSLEMWVATLSQHYAPKIFVPYLDHPFFNQLIKAKKEGIALHSGALDFEEKNSFFHHFFNNTIAKSTPEERKNFVFQSKGVVWSSIPANSLSLLIANYQARPYSDQENEVFKRFANVFEQAYTRFLDLQKAEAQAREAQIEAALERVRSRTMAMHHTEELKEVIQVVFDQFVGLNINVEHAGFILDYKEREDMHIWLADHQQGVPTEITIPYFESPHWNSYLEAKAKQESFFANLLPFEVKNKFYKDLLELIPELTEEARQAIFSKPALAISTVLLDNVGLYIEHYSETPFSAEENAVLMRFGKVFQQTYTRFLDLQKAEAQARESEIELGLERVRARAMAMHHSDELNQLIGTIFSEFTRLDMTITRAALYLFEPETKSSRWWMANSEAPTKPMNYMIPYHEHPPYLAWLKAREKKDLKWIYHLKGKIKRDWDKFLFSKTELSLMPDFIIKGMRKPESVILTASFNNYGSISLATLEPLPENQLDILIRFSKVFEQTYTRFLDLQKAEEQAKEAQIEVALEKVRSRTMGMQSSDELPEVANMLFLEVQALGINAWSCGYNILEEDYTTATCIMSSKGTLQTPFQLRLWGEASFDEMGEFIHNDKAMLVQELGGEALVLHYAYMKSFPDLKPTFDELDRLELSLPTYQINHLCKFSHGFLLFITYEKVPDAHDIFKRFTKVFDQTYTRFLDLKRAESQAREAQINLAVERVRAKALAMHRSEEIIEVVAKLKDEVIDLNIPDVVATTIFLREGKDQVRMWDLSTVQKRNGGFELSLDMAFKIKEKDPHLYVKRLWENPENYCVELQDQKGFTRYIAWLREHDKNQIADEIKTYAESGLIHHMYHAAKKLNSGKLVIDLMDSPSEEIETILTKMGAAFDLAYKRFEDLKKAEAQAREAQIEAALERVRSRSLAMHKSEELADLSMELVKQVQTLGMESWFCAFNIYDDDPRGSVEWGSNGQGTFPTYRTPREGVFLRYFEAGQRGETLLVNEIGEEECPAHYEYLCSLPGVGEQLLQMKAAGIPFPTSQIDHVAFFKYGYVLFITFEPTPESHDIFKRFAHVFEQSYTRFLDLQKAEVQAREALIEAALERVRSKTMSMHNSKDVGQTISLMFDELLKLGVEKSIRCGIGILHATNPMELWTASTDKDEKIVLDIGFLDMNLHPLLVGAKAAWQARKKQFTYELNGIDLKNYFRAINNAPEYSLQVDLETLPPSIIHNDFFFTEGMLFTFSPGPISDELEKVFKRFAAVFGQTYRRYLDLQNAELQAKEAIKRASLDRVRGEIASMRSTADLDRITPLIWQELTNLSIPFIRCGVFIMNETNEIIDAHLASPEGQSLGILQLRFSDSETTKESVIHWRQQKLYTQHWNKAEFVQWTQTLIEKGQVENPQSYQGSVMPPESLHLHFVPFNQGMLYVGNTHALINEELTAVQSLAEAFSIAFARYEDFKTLEIAKQNIENTLSELKATQSQLIQSEKLASLGQLTAGIAHEIKNPLNFVNNFSDLSMELIDEVFEVLDDSNNPESSEDIRELLTVVKSNLEKIYLHGTRADGIVKSMLQHSRGGSGILEPTDLNGLVKEYVNLAFHGMRAGKNPINVTIDLHLDSKISTVPLIAEDFSRVILNLCNNAFDACAERSRSTKRDKVLRSEDRGTKTEEEEESGNVEYNAKLKVTTSLENKCIRISCEDNGPGIPDEIKDKILQPFFTTKKGTEGTGLGLSITNDIIKAHGGSLEVHTEEGKGTTFTIILTTAN